MVNPSAAEVETAYNNYKAKHDVQSEKKDAFDDEQQEVAAMFDTAKTLVSDIWDEVEFFYRKEPTEASKRRKCREWGVVYKSRHKANISGTVTDSASSEPLTGVNVSIVESGEAVQTDDEGKYTLHTDHNGEGTLEFLLAGYRNADIPDRSPRRRRDNAGCEPSSGVRETQKFIINQLATKPCLVAYNSILRNEAGLRFE